MTSYNFLLFKFKTIHTKYIILEKTCPPSTLIKYPQCPVLIPLPLLQSTGSNITNHKLFLIMSSMRWSDLHALYITKDFLYLAEDTNKNLIIKSTTFHFHSQSTGLKTQNILFSTYTEIARADSRDICILNNYPKEHVWLASISKVADWEKMASI